jgi:hypothetical protein
MAALTQALALRTAVGFIPTAPNTGGMRVRYLADSKHMEEGVRYLSAYLRFYGSAH